MANTPTVYVICDNNCKYEGLTKEQILTAITKAVNEGTIGNIDTGFVTTIKTINGLPLRFFVGSQDEYNVLTEEQKQGLFALITNDTTAENLKAKLELLAMDFDQYKENISEEFWKLAEGEIVVGAAKSAETATSAETAKTLTNGDVTFGRERIYKPIISTGIEITATAKRTTFSKDLTQKLLVVDVSVYAADIYENTYLGKYRTIPFCPINATYNGVGFAEKYYLTIASAKIAFWVDGEYLYHQLVEGGSAETGNRYYITGVYEEY